MLYIVTGGSGSGNPNMPNRLPCSAGIGRRDTLVSGDDADLG